MDELKIPEDLQGEYEKSCLSLRYSSQLIRRLIERIARLTENESRLHGVYSKHMELMNDPEFRASYERTWTSELKECEQEIARLTEENTTLKARAEATEAALLVWESAGILAIKAADKMADVCDDWVKRGLLDARSALADARLIYGDPYFPVLPKILEEAARLAAAQKGGTQ